MATVDRARWASTVVLGDGSSAEIRPIEPADRDDLAAFHARQSEESVYRRFFSAKPRLTEAELRHFTEVDFVDRVALVMRRHGEFIAWASYERWPHRGDAEAAFMVDDAHQGLGIATLLLEHLAAIARSNGINRFTAEVLADNRPMMVVFTRAGWPVERHFDSGVIDVEFDLHDTTEFLDSVERREQRADSRAMARLLLPRSIAVLGASDRPGSIGADLWTQLSGGFAGPLYAVNPHRDRLGDVVCHPSVAAIGEEVSLALIAVPASALPGAIEDCIAARVRGAVIITAVDPATDPSGAAMAELVARARRNGLRIIGPASFGFASPQPEVRIDAAMVPVTLAPGGVAISLQSGTLASSVLLLAAQLDLGLSWFVSLGDKSDVSGNDLLQFWEDDAATSVVAMYTESFGNPRKFARLARRVAQRRPIVAVRTGAALGGVATSALYQQCGVIEVPSVSALLDTARVLATQPLMDSPRVAVVSNARSPQVLAEAALRAAGLEVVAPPVSLDWTADDDRAAAALQAAVADPHIAAVMVVHAPPTVAVAEGGGPVAAIEAAARAATKPIVAVMLGARDGRLAPGSQVQRFAFPEPAAAVLGRVYAYSAWRRSEGAAVVTAFGDVDPEGAEGVIAAALGGTDMPAAAREVTHEVTMPPDAIRALVGSYGIAMADCRVVPHDEAADAATEIGFPVAVKAIRRHPGRSVPAGVALDVGSAPEVRRVVAEMRARLGVDAEQVIVQEMAEPGVDLRVHITTDDRLGAVVTVGFGGANADLIGDESSRLAPLSHPAAVSMLRTTRLAGAVPLEAQPAVLEVIRRAAQLAADHPGIIELDLNPVLVGATGATVVDARCRVGVPSGTASPLRRLE